MFYTRLLTFLLLGGALLAQSPVDKPTSGCRPVCNGCFEQSFSVHETGGARFTLVVRFTDYLWGVTGTRWYLGYPVIVEYNASCLHAHHVTYHKKQKTIEGWGDVRLEDGSGKQEHFDAVLLKFDSGTLTPIKLLKGKERTALNHPEVAP